ncbi:hypothetical protein M23134_04665 [Microscilla marina ATCC 23134]|uniref:Uncharacterized protein n=1 Tax=Microscilla marina ATCC 23134 TaxID=313606 RepID=A1ZTG5_MICM2|nr:hypothetical protein M23134_04665 [Microscilla marina ATCC 23134]
MPHLTHKSSANGFWVVSLFLSGAQFFRPKTPGLSNPLSGRLFKFDS